MILSCRLRLAASANTKNGDWSDGAAGSSRESYTTSARSAPAWWVCRTASRAAASTWAGTGSNGGTGRASRVRMVCTLTVKEVGECVGVAISFFGVPRRRWTLQRLHEHDQQEPDVGDRIRGIARRCSFLSDGRTGPSTGIPSGALVASALWASQLLCLPRCVSADEFFRTPGPRGRVRTAWPAAGGVRGTGPGSAPNSRWACPTPRSARDS